MTRTQPEPTAHSPALTSTALRLLESLSLQRARVRTCALRANRLQPAEQAHHQLSLDPADHRARQAEATRRLLRVRSRSQVVAGTRDRVVGGAGGDAVVAGHAHPEGFQRYWRSALVP